MKKKIMRNYRWVSLVYIFVFWLAGLLVGGLLAGCTTTKETTTSVERHKMETMMTRMDSLMQSHWHAQQDSSWHETVIKQLQSIKEHNDTSKTVVVDSTGKVIKETVTIVREREVEKESDRLEREGMIHRLEVMDSTLRVVNKQISKMDSMIQVSHYEKVVEKKEPWYRRLWNNIELILIGIVIGAIVVLTKNLWMKLIKK